MDIDLDSVVDPDADGDAGVPHGEVLLRFATAAQRGDPALGAHRAALEGMFGLSGVVEAAATVSVFNGLVRVAEGTGIQLDDGVVAYSQDFRGRLGIDAYAGAANTAPLGRTLERPSGDDVRRLFT